MDGKFRSYDWINSSARIREILDQPAGQFEKVAGLPNREKLTYTNGFYGMCSAVFIDIRDSSSLPGRHNRPVLAKIYRSFISEMVAVLNSSVHVREVNIVGDCVWATYSTSTTHAINEVFRVAFTARTLLDLLNHHFSKKGFSPIQVGIGVDYGRVLMVKAGYNGSGINDVVYMGDVVNQAAGLASEAGRRGRDPIFVGSNIYVNLNEHNQGLLTPTSIFSFSEAVYSGDVVSTEMHDWVKALR